MKNTFMHRLFAVCIIMIILLNKSHAAANDSELKEIKYYRTLNLAAFGNQGVGMDKLNTFNLPRCRVNLRSSIDLIKEHNFGNSMHLDGFSMNMEVMKNEKQTFFE